MKVTADMIAPPSASDWDSVEAWVQQLGELRQVGDASLIRQAAEMGFAVGSFTQTPYGYTCFELGLCVASTLTALRLDSHVIAAALVLSAVEYAGLPIVEVEEQLGPQVASLISGAERLQSLHQLQLQRSHEEHSAAHVDNVRNMLLAMVDDVRIVVIKLAERLCVMKNLKNLPAPRQKKMAALVRDVYAPLANRLGIGQIKWQLEDFSFRYLNPDEYMRISKGLQQRRGERETYVATMIETLRTCLEAAGIQQIDISGRAKHVYSIYRKMMRKDVDLKEIYDVIALRVMVPSLEDCYTALSSVHGQWEHVSQEFDDYIAQPKPNGYSSIHTAIIGPDGRHVEIQIRTFAMHDRAEFGVAAHWLYKEGSAEVGADCENKMTWLRQLMDWQKEIAGDDAQAKEMYREVFADQVYVFTPVGEVKALPKGATSLDFAYSIHTEVGHRCKGAKVDGKMIPLTAPLKTGQSIEILTGKHPQPSRDWLNPHQGYLVSRRARSKVHQWFRKQDYDQHVAQGQNILDKEQRRLGYKLIYRRLLKPLHFRKGDDLLAALGNGDLSIGHLVVAWQRLQEKDAKPAALSDTDIAARGKKTTSKPGEIQGFKTLMTHTAQCCKAVPGDPIVGYITRGYGVSIHRKECSNMHHLKEDDKERLMDMDWDEAQSSATYPVDLRLEVQDPQKVVGAITVLLSNSQISLVALSARQRTKDDAALIYLSLEVSHRKQLDALIDKLKAQEKIMAVTRVS